MSLTGLTLTQARDGLRARQFTSRELTDAHLQAVERLNPRLNAFITITADQARAQPAVRDGVVAQ